MTRARLAGHPALILLLALASTGGVSSRELDVRPERQAPPPARPLEGRARSYYAYCLSQQALLERDYAGARIHLEEAVRTDPGSAELKLELARVYMSLRMPEAALERAREAAQIQPGNPEPLRVMVDLYRAELGEVDEPPPDLIAEALAAHIALLEVDPGDADVRLSLARIHYAQGNYAQSAAILTPHVQGHPEDSDAVFFLARTLSRSGRPDAARSVLEQGVAARPEVPELRAALAEAREESGDLEGSGALLDSLVAEYPDRVEFRFALARVLELRGLHDEAAREAGTVVDRLRSAAAGTREEADLRTALIIFIEATANAGHLDRALQTTLDAEKRFPDEVRFSLKRAEILYFQGHDDSADAILQGLATRSVDSIPRSRLSMVILRVGAAKEREGAIDRAEALLRKAIQVDAGNHAALNYLGYMLADRNRALDEALDLVQRAVKLDGTSGAYLDSLGWVLFKLGRLEEAEEPLRRAAEAIPAEAVVHDHLGDLLHARGRLPEAIASWNEALRLGIEDPARVEAKVREATQAPPAR